MQLPPLRKFLPRGRGALILAGLLLFLFFLALPFLAGGSSSFMAFMRSAGQDPAITSEIVEPNGQSVPKDFSPLRTEGPLSVTSKDAQRGAWSWSQAKRLSSRIWLGRVSQSDYQSFYCGCAIGKSGSTGGRVDMSSCGLEPRKSVTRASRLEWEHVVPASIIGRGHSCWEQGAPECVGSDGKAFAGRSCCEIADPYYNMAATDPVNLVPAVGEINGDRSNFPYGEIAGEKREYGACDMEIDRSSRLAEPPADRRGDIARIWAYMSRSYGIAISSSQAKLYQRWMQEDPVSREEIIINQAIAKEGYRSNPFVLGPAKVKGGEG